MFMCSGRGGVMSILALGLGALQAAPPGAAPPEVKPSGIRRVPRALVFPK